MYSLDERIVHGYGNIAARERRFAGGRIPAHLGVEAVVLHRSAVCCGKGVDVFFIGTEELFKGILADGAVAALAVYAEVAVCELSFAAVGLFD